MGRGARARPLYIVIGIPQLPQRRYCADTPPHESHINLYGNVFISLYVNLFNNSTKTLRKHEYKLETALRFCHMNKL